MPEEFDSLDFRLYLLGQMRAVRLVRGQEQALDVQPKPLRLLAYLALLWQSPHHREELQAFFWPDKDAAAAANNLRQALWHLRRALSPETLCLEGDWVQWNAQRPPWVDALAFQSALDGGDLDGALDLYAGPLLPETYDEWAQLQRERLHMGYLTALEARGQRCYEAGHWTAAQADAEKLLAADPLNETAACLLMACHWALGQREAARRIYDALRCRLVAEINAEPLPETTALYRRILCGEAHPGRSAVGDDDVPPAEAAQTAHLSLLETLGAFRQGLEQATAWATASAGRSLAAARRWQGRFHLRMGRLPEAHAALSAALSLAASLDLKAAVLVDLATTETGMGHYAAAEEHYAQALVLSPLDPATRLRLLSSLGGLQGRQGRTAEARCALEEAMGLAREQDDTAALAVTSGNLGILLIGQGEVDAAERVLGEGLEAARQADAHWLTAHLTGHLGVLAQDRDDLEGAARHYEGARTLAEAFGDQRGAALWTLNLGIVRYEQGRYADAVPLLTAGRERAAGQASRSLEAGAYVFVGSCLVALGEEAQGLADIEAGLALAREIGDRERILMGLLHFGRALAALERGSEARDVLLEGLEQAEVGDSRRLAGYFRTELETLSGR